MQSNSERKLAENEVLARELNRNVQQYIEEETDKAITGRPLQFLCECSLADCDLRIGMTVKKYKSLHKNSSQFLIKPGHAVSEIERIVLKDKQYEVVEKFITPPQPEDIK